MAGIQTYSYLDEDAPEIPSATGRRLIDNLKILLKACLVDGYGSKPGAGWTLGHEHPDGISFSNGNGFVAFAAAASHGSAIELYALESISDGSTAVPSGLNKRSGEWHEGYASTSRQRIFCSGFSGASPAGFQWCVVADERTAIVSIMGGTANQVLVDPNNNTSQALYFGEYTPTVGGTGFCVLGGFFGASLTGSGVLLNPAAARGCSLRNPFTGLVAQGNDAAYRLAIGCIYSDTSITQARMIPPAPRITSARASITGKGTQVSGSATLTSDVLCGAARGVVYVPELSSTLLENTLTLLGVEGPQVQDRFRPLTVPGGDQWIPLYPNTTDLGAFISLNPADWE